MTVWPVSAASSARSNGPAIRDATRGIKRLLPDPAFVTRCRAGHDPAKTAADRWPGTSPCWPRRRGHRHCCPRTFRPHHRHPGHGALGCSSAYPFGRRWQKPEQGRECMCIVLLQQLLSEPRCRRRGQRAPGLGPSHLPEPIVAVERQHDVANLNGATSWRAWFTSSACPILVPLAGGWSNMRRTARPDHYDRRHAAQGGTGHRTSTRSCRSHLSSADHHAIGVAGEPAAVEAVTVEPALTARGRSATATEPVPVGRRGGPGHRGGVAMVPNGRRAVVPADAERRAASAAECSAPRPAGRRGRDQVPGRHPHPPHPVRYRLRRPGPSPPPRRRRGTQGPGGRRSDALVVRRRHIAR
jgi:hypothetical protein